MNPAKHCPLTIALLALATLNLLGPANTHAAVGDLYVGDTATNTVTRVTPGGTKTVFASTVGAPISLVFDQAGNLFVKDNSGFKIFKVTPNGTVSPFASNASGGGLAIDGGGNVFLAETGNHLISKFTPAGVKSTFITGLNSPFDLTFDPFGNLYCADFGNNAVYKIPPGGGGFTQTITGITNPGALAFDPYGNLFVAGGGKLYKVAPFTSPALFADGVGSVKRLVCDKIGAVYATNLSGSIFRFDTAGNKSTYLSGFGAAHALTQEPPRAQPLNIATRLQVQTGDNALIGGFIITGNAGKKVLIRGVGPSLAQFGIAGALQDPNIELRDSAGTFVNGNNNWKDTQQTAIQNTGLAPSDNRESALLITLSPGAWTVVMRGIGSTTGVGVVEVYDLDPAVDSKLANISTRGLVQTGENVMIGGFIIGGGNGSGRVVVRALGASLTAFGIANALHDPTLEIHNASGATIATNDDWRFPQHDEIYFTGLAPSDEGESAIVQTLPNGNYTAVVAGNTHGTGIGVVEVYNLP